MRVSSQAGLTRALRSPTGTLAPAASERDAWCFSQQLPEPAVDISFSSTGKFVVPDCSRNSSQSAARDSKMHRINSEQLFFSGESCVSSVACQTGAVKPPQALL